MTGPVLLAVHDSPAAFVAAQVAADLARRFGARLHAVAVLEPGGQEPNGVLDAPVDRGPLAEHGAGVGARAGAEHAARAALRHVASVCAAAGVELTTRLRAGNVAAEILAEAREVDAVVIVLARVDRPGHALPYLGSHTLRVLEFAAVPVLVVPLT